MREAHRAPAAGFGRTARSSPHAGQSPTLAGPSGAGASATGMERRSWSSLAAARGANVLGSDEGSVSVTPGQVTGAGRLPEADDPATAAEVIVTGTGAPPIMGVLAATAVAPGTLVLAGIAVPTGSGLVPPPPPGGIAPATGVEVRGIGIVCP